MNLEKKARTVSVETTVRALLRQVVGNGFRLPAYKSVHKISPESYSKIPSPSKSAVTWQ